MLTCFGMIWNYNKISKQNTKFGEIYALSKIHISTYDILGQLQIQYIKSFKTSHLKIPLEENMFLGKRTIVLMQSKHLGLLYVIWTQIVNKSWNTKLYG
jgi:hypothetical protein